MIDFYFDFPLFSLKLYSKNRFAISEKYKFYQKKNIVNPDFRVNVIRPDNKDYEKNLKGAVFFHEYSRYLKDVCNGANPYFNPSLKFLRSEKSMLVNNTEVCSFFESRSLDDIVFYPNHHYLLLFDIKSREGICALAANGGLNAALNENVFYFMAANALSLNKGFLCHASCLCFDEKAYLFVGKSGAGKSTIYHFSSREYRISDDGSGVYEKHGNFFIGTYPFHHGEELDYFHEKDKYPLKSVFLLEHGEETSVTLLDSMTALPLFFPAQVHFYNLFTKDQRKDIYNVLSDLMKKTNFYLLRFKKDDPRLFDLVKKT